MFGPGIFRIGDGLGFLVPFFGLGLQSSFDYEVHKGLFSQDVLSFASSIVNTHLQADFHASWLIAVTWTHYQGNAVSLKLKYSSILALHNLFLT